MIRPIRRSLAVVLLLFAASAVLANPYDDAMRTVRVLSNSSHVRLLSFGKSHSGRSIPAFVISDFTTDSRDKTRILISSGQHGDEIDPVRSMLSMCKSIAADNDPDLLRKCAIIVVPMVNPDGTAAHRRKNAVGVDTNRDWSALTTCEARFVHCIIKAWKPHLMIDVHQWNEPSVTPGNSIEVPNCGSDSREEAMVAVAETAGKSSGLTLVECHPMSDKSLFHRRYSALGYAAYLLETKNGESYTARDRSYRIAIKSLISSVIKEGSTKYIISPASMEFRPDMVGVYLDSITNKSNASSLFGAAMLSVACIILVCLMKPFAQKEHTAWSRRFIMCAVDPDIGSDRLHHRHVPHPITARSWVNRRLRSRYASAPASDEKDKPKSDDPDRSLQMIHYALRKIMESSPTP